MKSKFQFSINYHLKDTINFHITTQNTTTTNPQYIPPRHNYSQIQNSEKQQPYHHQITHLRSTIFDTIMCLLSFISILISVFLIYYQCEQTEQILLNSISIITILLVILLVCKNYFKKQWNSKKALYVIFEIVLYLPHPTTYTNFINQELHLILLIRILLIIRCMINESNFYNPRAFRVITMYGIQQDNSMLFAVKSILRSLSFEKIIIMYLSLLILFTHCLYVASKNNFQSTNKTFIDCFQTIGTTFTTVGYGDSILTTSLERFVMVLCICIGAITNSFLTLSSLVFFSMKTQQQNSHSLLVALQQRDKIEYNSMEFIGKCLRNKEHDTIVRKEIYKQFRKKIRRFKNNINLLNRNGVVENLSANFKENLDSLKSKILVTQNLIRAVIKKLQKNKKVGKRCKINLSK